MNKNNVLLVGISGAGKSTLINGICGKKIATVTNGDSTTKEIVKYEDDHLPFALFDTRGFEYNWVNQKKTVKEMKKLIKKGLGEDDDAESSDVIGCVWYCVDATSGKLHKENINSLKAIISNWKDVPVVVVLTKSYSTPEQQENISMVKEQFQKYGKSVNVVDIIPVVAAPFPVNEEYIVGQQGIEELVDKTNDIVEASDVDGAKEAFNKKQRRYKAELLVNAFATGAGVIGAIPIPFADAIPLTALETKMISQLGKIYDLKEDGENKEKISMIFKNLLAAGTVGFLAKQAINGLKALPGINIAAELLNSIMAVFVVEVLGQVSIMLFEEIDAGQLDVSKLDEINEFIEKTTNEKMKPLLDKISGFFKDNNGKFDIKQFVSMFKKKS